MAVKPHELLQSTFEIHPVGGSGPRFWVRRLVIWKEPGGEVIRDVSLRPGLNIVWTPEDQGIGHGGGKTLFCRLLRYCLGEERFAPEAQRDRISATFLNGIVGAEVMLDGTCWCIVRPLGTRRRHYAVPDANLDELAGCQTTPTGIEPFVDAVESALLGTEVAGLIPRHRQDQKAWPIALAWLSRDQECRFNHVLDWRSNLSDSDSPARGLTQTEKLDAVRALLQAITPEEKALRGEVAALEERRRQQEQELGHRSWEFTRLKQGLLADLKVAEDAFTEGQYVVPLLRKAAQEALSRTLGMKAENTDQALEEARGLYERAQEELRQKEQRIAALEAELPGIRKVISLIQNEQPALRYAFEEAESFPCPICEVPIDRSLAEACKLSHKLPDVEQCRKRLEASNESLTEEIARAKSVEDELARIRPELALARQQADQRKRLYLKQELLVRTRNVEWYAAQSRVDDVERLAALMDSKQAADVSMQKALAAAEQKRSQVQALMENQAQVIDRLAERFDGVIRQLVGPDARGEIRLTGKGLSLVVHMGGDRSTSAIDSLKVVAFDLAVLCLSLEGRTNVPAFLVHDSPREADLGLELYGNLFRLAHWLEMNAGGEHPGFQYIVTTTTPPPDGLSKQPWLRLCLSGAKAEARLFKTDL